MVPQMTAQRDLEWREEGVCLSDQLPPTLISDTLVTGLGEGAAIPVSSVPPFEVPGYKI